MASSRVLSTVSLFPIEMDTHYIPRLTSVTSTRSESKNTFCRFVELFDNGRRRYRIALSKRLPTQNSTLYCVRGKKKAHRDEFRDVNLSFLGQDTDQ